MGRMGKYGGGTRVCGCVMRSVGRMRVCGCGMKGCEEG